MFCCGRFRYNYDSAKTTLLRAAPFAFLDGTRMHASIETAVLIRLSRSHRRRDERLDAETVIARLEEAGRTLIALPGRGCLPAGYRAAWPEFPQLQIEAYGYTEEEARPAVPSAAAITRMDEAFAWVRLIPSEKQSWRKIVLLRSLVNPITDRHRWSWRRIGKHFGWHHQAVQQWHCQGIDKIVVELREEMRVSGDIF